MEKKKKYNQASLLLHAIVDNLDNSHFMYDKEKGRLEFNVGKVARKSNFSHIDFIIIKSNKESVRPAKRNNTERFAVVVTTPEFPKIENVDSFLESSNRSVDIIDSLAEILKVMPESSNEGSKTDYEKEKNFNSREVFEDVYQKAVRKMMERLEQFKKSEEYFEDKIENSGIASRKATYKMALQKVKREMIGDTASQFKSIFMKVLDEIAPEFKENLNSENRKRLNSRIEQFYSEIA
jgi:hypothetical protein